MPSSVKLTDLELAFDYVSSAGIGENQAYLCKESGKIYWHSDYYDNFEELPDDVDDDDKYIQIPDKRELDLGKPLVFDFTHQFLPRDVDEVRRIFSKKGAYARFKDLLARRNKVKDWLDFQEEAQERALRQWCELNDIVLDETAGGPAPSGAESPQPAVQARQISTEPKAILSGAEPQLFVADVRASADFYVQKLGFSIVFLYGDPPFYGQVKRDRAALDLRCVDRPVIDGALRDREELLSAAITVDSADDIEQLFLELQSAGVTFHQTLKRQPWGAQNFIVKDLDGNLLLFAGPAE
jgi:uncharacterized glyoxalase superfamily protein PhnB